jgi:hypothetical protein
LRASVGLVTVPLRSVKGGIERLGEEFVETLARHQDT